MTTVTFSIEDESLIVYKENNYIGLYNEQMRCIASNLPEKENYAFGKKLYHIPQSLIRTPKSDEELAEEYAKEMKCDDGTTSVDFLAGRESFGDKKFHLSEEDIESIIWGYAECKFDSPRDYIKSYLTSLTPPVYPHTITVEHDGENYLWETLKAEY